jgi:hypothetical protein
MLLNHISTILKDNKITHIRLLQQSLPIQIGGLCWF